LSTSNFDGKITPTYEFKENEKASLRRRFWQADVIRSNAPSATLGNPMAQAIEERLKQDGVNAQVVSKDWVLKDELSFDVKPQLASYIYQYGNSQVVLVQRCTRETFRKTLTESC